MNNSEMLVDNYIKEYRPRRDDLRVNCIGITNFNALFSMAYDFFQDHWYRLIKLENSAPIKMFQDVLDEHRNDLLSCNSFEDFLSILHKLKDKHLKDCKIGPTFLYDVSLVLGMSKDALPHKVYLNNSKTINTTKVILGTDYDSLKKTYKGHVTFSASSFPKELNVLLPHEIEDFCYIYHDTFKLLK